VSHQQLFLCLEDCGAVSDALDLSFDHHDLCQAEYTRLLFQLSEVLDRSHPST
jgi:hypothetical protein